MQTKQDLLRKEDILTLLSREERKSKEKNLAEQFDSDMQINEEERDRISDSQEDLARKAFASAKMKRKSFASQKPLARVSLIKSALSFDSGQKSAPDECGTLSDSQTINRRAAFRRISNLAKVVIPEYVRISRFSKGDDEVPGNFIPRTSLKRQRSISADSLNNIRSNQTLSTKESHNNNYNKELDDDDVNIEQSEIYKDIIKGDKQDKVNLIIAKRGLSMSNPEINSILETAMENKMDYGFIVKSEKADYSSTMSKDSLPEKHCNVKFGGKVELAAKRSFTKGGNENVKSLEEHGINPEIAAWTSKKAPGYEEEKKNLGRTVSDSVTIGQPAHPRLVKFASTVEHAQGYKRLQRTPTPYWAESCDKEGSDKECEDSSFDSGGGSMDLPKFL